MTARRSVPIRRRPFLRDGGVKALSPRERLEECLAAIDAGEADVQAFTALNITGARAAADRASERQRDGRRLSSIDGIILGIKDIIETADMPTGMGSPLYEGWQSRRDAASVVALREAGAIILGKTVTTEFAATVSGKTRNPWDLARTPGGSSSGSAAAVAAGFVEAALGTQVIGSTIRPASFCGCVGFKPTAGALNRGGSHDAFSQSCTGVIGACLEDVWQIAYEIAARAGGDPGFPGLIGPAAPPAARQPTQLILLETAGWGAADPRGRALLDEALARLAAAGIRIARRQSDAAVERAEVAIAQAFPVSSAINAWEGRWPLNTYRDRDADGLSAAMRERLRVAESMTLADYRVALAQRAAIRETYAQLAGPDTVCVTLSASGPAPEGLGSTGNPAFAVPASVLGVPAVTLPLFAVDGLPLGLQVLGFKDGDADVFAAAAWILQALGADQKP